MYDATYDYTTTNEIRPVEFTSVFPKIILSVNKKIQ